MSPEKCKKLLDAGILQAYAEGKVIESKVGDTWMGMIMSQPQWLDSSLYRVAPEEKEIVLWAVYLADGTLWSAKTEEQYARHNLEQAKKRYPGAYIVRLVGHAILPGKEA